MNRSSTISSTFPARRSRRGEHVSLRAGVRRAFCFFRPSRDVRTPWTRATPRRPSCLSMSARTSRRPRSCASPSTHAVLFSRRGRACLQARRAGRLYRERSDCGQGTVSGGPFKSSRGPASHPVEFPAERRRSGRPLVTASSAPAHERVVRTCAHGTSEIDEALFLGGSTRVRSSRPSAPISSSTISTRTSLRRASMSRPVTCRSASPTNRKRRCA